MAVLVSRDENCRVLKDSDMPWVLELGVKRYADRFDIAGSAAWISNTVLRNPMMFYAARSQNAFCVSMLHISPWLPNDMECHLLLLCADDGCMWEAARLLRASVAWARYRKCKVWRLTSETEVELAPLAIRMGATEISPRFLLRL